MHATTNQVLHSTKEPIRCSCRIYTSMIYLTCCFDKLSVISKQMILLSTVTVSHLIYNNVNRNCNVLSITCLLGFKNVTWLALNPGKTMTMLFSTMQHFRVHLLHEYVPGLCIGGNQLERLDSAPLLGTQLHHHLTWTNEITTKICGCYKTLSILRKLEHCASYKIRKQLSECLVLSKLDYSDIVSHPIPKYLMKRLQQV